MTVTRVTTLSIPMSGCYGLDIDPAVYQGLNDFQHFVESGDYQRAAGTVTTTTRTDTTTTLPPWGGEFAGVPNESESEKVDARLKQNLLGVSAAAVALILSTLQACAAGEISRPTADILSVPHNGEREVFSSPIRKPARFEWSDSLYEARKAAKEYGTLTHADH